MSKIVPFEDQVVILPVAEATTTAMGLYIPESARKRTISGTVVAVGPTVEHVKVEDLVVYQNGTNVTLDDVEYVVVKQENVLGKIIG